MDWQWKAFAVTFGVVFLAELGDKTQIATMNFAAKGYPVVSVFTGSALALVLSALLGTLFGAAFTRLVSPAVLSKVSGALFVVIGVLILTKRM